MAVRSRTFVLTNSVPSGATGIEYTVPAERTAILKQVTGFASSVTATTLVVSVLRTGVATRVINLPVPADTAVQVPVFLVLHPGDKLQIRRGAGTLAAMASGALLFGEPE